MASPSADEETGERHRRTRWPFVVVSLFAILAVLAVWAWYGWLPNYRPTLADGERYGVDVSNHQGEVDWRRVAADDMEFAYIKATEGGDFVDEWFERNWEGAGAAGLDRGAYHFFTLCRSGDEQAANFLSVAPIDPDALPPVVDLELAGNCADRPDRAWVERELGAFLEAVESATGQTVALYVGDDFEGKYQLRDELDRPIWHRRVLIRPDVDGWWIWQVHGYASIDGIEGGADLNVMRDHDAIRRTEAPTPRVTPDLVPLAEQMVYLAPKVSLISRIQASPTSSPYQTTMRSLGRR